MNDVTNPMLLEISPIDINFSNLSKDQLETLSEAGQAVLECHRILAKSQANVVSEVLKGQGDFYEWDHYPAGDVYDWDSHSQFYYHAHPPEKRANIWGAENGHFHTFLRPKGMPDGAEPAALADFNAPKDPNDALTHFVAISMDDAGIPLRLFTTNRWVTGEVWYPADTVVRMLDLFIINQALPSWPTNMWITNLVVLFRPQIEVLLHRRDKTVEAWQASHPDVNAYEDRNLEVTSIVDIDIDAQITAVQAALDKFG